MQPYSSSSSKITAQTLHAKLSIKHTDLQIVTTWAIVGHEIMGQGEGGSVAESYPAQLSFQLWKVDPTNGT